MDSRQTGFFALVTAQAAHSIEEYVGRLHDVFPPAAFVSGLLAADQRLGLIAFSQAARGIIAGHRGARPPRRVARADVHAMQLVPERDAARHAE